MFLLKIFIILPYLLCYMVAVPPGLTSQRHSALISSDLEYFQVCFSAVHYLKISEQRWFSLKQRWFRAEQRWFPLKQRWTALFFEYFRMTIVGLFYTLFKISLSTSISRHINLVFSPVYEKKWATKINFFIFVQGKDMTNTRIFGFTVTAQVTKQIWFNFSKTFLHL